MEIVEKPRWFFELTPLLLVVDEELRSELHVLSMDEARYQHAVTWLVNDLQAVRFSLLTDAITVGDIWKAVRDNETACDVVLGLTATIRFHADCLYENGWDALQALVAKAMGVFVHPKMKTELCALEDNAELERFVSTPIATDLILSNPWLVTLYLLRRSVLIRELLDQSVKLASRVVKAKES